MTIKEDLITRAKAVTIFKEAIAEIERQAIQNVAMAYEAGYRAGLASTRSLSSGETQEASAP